MRLSFRDIILSFGRMGTRRRPRLASLPEPPALRLLMKPVAASWHPAKATDGSLQTQIVVDLECTNNTSSPIQLMTAALRDHAADQTVLLVVMPEGKSAADLPVPARGKARVHATFFLKGRPHPPGKWFNDVVTLIDQEWREHALTIAVRGH